MSEEEAEKLNAEFQKDSDKLDEHFFEFTRKYGDKIAGFYILKLKKSCWKINVVKDGELFR